MYPTSGDQHNFFNSTQGVDALVSAFDAAVSSLSFSDDEDYVYASDYNSLVDRFNRLARRANAMHLQCSRLVEENHQLRRMLQTR
jgi:hypothetical protein